MRDPRDGSPAVGPGYDDGRWVFTGDTSLASGKRKGIPALPITVMAEAEATVRVADTSSRAQDPAATPALRGRWNDYGIGLLLQGDLKGAEAAFLRVTQLDPEYADGWVNVARARIQEGNMSGAEEMLRRALPLDPDLAKTHFFLGTALKALGRYDEALGHGFLKLAIQNLAGKARFLAGNAAALPLDSGACDVVVSGLVLNFVPDLRDALSEMRRVTAAGGTIAAYVWDYADGMEVIKYFWDAAVSLDPAAAQLHEGVRFPVCKPSALKAVFEEAGLTEVETRPLDLKAQFVDFEDYWRPFLGGQGPAPAYAMSLPREQRAALRAKLESVLPSADGRAISLNARAWAVRGTKRSNA